MFPVTLKFVSFIDWNKLVIYIKSFQHTETQQLQLKAGPVESAGLLSDPYERIECPAGKGKPELHWE